MSENENIWGDDLLDRADDGRMLEAYLLGMHRNGQFVDRDQSLVVNLDAGWGGGKTFFLERFAKQLEASGHKVLRINAWNTDFAEDPLVAIMAPLLNELAPEKSVSKALKPTVNRALETGGRIAAALAKGGIKQGLKKVVGEDGLSELESSFIDCVSGEVHSTLLDANKMIFQTHNETVDAMAKFREALTALVDAKRCDGNKDTAIIVLIDELDRCMPLYAIKMLERLKHIFQTKGLIFLVATDTEQLAHSINAIYGQKFDSARYLKRFFTGTYTFSEPKISAMLEVHLQQQRYHNIRGHYRDEFIDEFPKAFEASFYMWRCRPRDVQGALDQLDSIAGFFGDDPVNWLYLLNEVLCFRQNGVSISNLQAASGFDWRSKQFNQSSSIKVREINPHSMHLSLINYTSIELVKFLLSLTTVNNDHLMQFGHEIDFKIGLRQLEKDIRNNADDHHQTKHYADLVARSGPRTPVVDSSLR